MLSKIRNGAGGIYVVPVGAHVIGLIMMSGFFATVEGDVRNDVFRIAVAVAFVFSGATLGGFQWRDAVDRCEHWKLLFFVAMLGVSWAMSEWHVVLEDLRIAIVFSWYTLFFIAISGGFGFAFVVEVLMRRWRAAR